MARQQVASAVNLVVQLTRMSDGSRRVQSIAECCGLDQAGERGQYVWNDLFQFQASGKDEKGRIQGTLRSTGKTPSFASEPVSMGLGEQVKLTTSQFSGAVAVMDVA